jgi:threonine/homoserine/homoserine lactone efflux protein
MMNVEILLALIVFAFVGSVTPGPNNLMLMASGANFGIRRTLPHFLGIIFGWMLMVILVGVGLVQVFEAFPLSYELLRWFSIGYLVYLAVKIATSGSPVSRGNARPMTALQAALFQWVNPKAWAMALTAVSVYAPSQSLAAVMLIALICGLINTPSIFVWVLMGSKLQTFLGEGARLQVFNYAMAALLLATLYPILVKLG